MKTLSRRVTDTTGEYTMEITVSGYDPMPIVPVFNGADVSMLPSKVHLFYEVQEDGTWMCLQARVTGYRVKPGGAESAHHGCEHVFTDPINPGHTPEGGFPVPAWVTGLAVRCLPITAAEMDDLRPGVTELETATKEKPTMDAFGAAVPFHEGPESADDLECRCPNRDDQYLMEVDCGSVYFTHAACGKPPGLWADDALSMQSVPVTLRWHATKDSYTGEVDDAYGDITINGLAIKDRQPPSTL